MAPENFDLRAFGGLEKDVQHLAQRIAHLEESIHKLEQRIGALTALLDQARGARWLLGTLVALASFVAGMAAAAKGFFPR
jgi:hypothetical protein